MQKYKKYHIRKDNSNNEYLLFLDTLITEQVAAPYPIEEHDPPYTFGAYSFFSLLDLDGNVVENHFLKTFVRVQFPFTLTRSHADHHREQVAPYS
jgi:hypothetical protein